MKPGTDRWISVRGIDIHIRQWTGSSVPFVLLHGLASNCLTWERVARLLNARGHPVIAVDQRGHGLSDKPESGYGFDEVTADLRSLIDALPLASPPVVAGQSWGGNVALEFAARYPGAASGIVLVDGGFIELAARPGASWDTISVELRPPSLAGMPRSEIAARLREGHPDWSEEGIEHSLGNFEALPDGTIRPWLTLERHMAILRALWDHRPSEVYPRVANPVLLIAADSGEGPWAEAKRAAVLAAEGALPRCRVHWLASTDHDIHVHRPEALASEILDAVSGGFLTS